MTGCRPALFTESAGLKGPVVIIGTVGRSSLIRELVKNSKIEVRQIEGKWESFFLQTVSSPLPGVPNALVIAGSDKRGTIYGIYDLCEQIGVSPLHFWADSPVNRKDALFVTHGKFLQGPPSVKYRGIFLNDESPDLSGWVAHTFGTIPPQNDPPIPPNVANYNSKFYEKVFELILRMKGNYLWPAMWNNAFNEDDPENPRLADEYGIVMGSSHQEPMLRAQKEWDRRYQKKLGSWNYYKHPDVLKDFWREGIRALTEAEGCADDGAWTLVVEDWSRPAFMQSPAPDARAYSPKALTPDVLDLLPTAKNHDLKSSRLAAFEPEDWVFALISLQTMSGVFGSGNYGVARMNGGYGSRAVAGLTTALGPGGRFLEDVRRLLPHHGQLLGGPGAIARAGLICSGSCPGTARAACPCQRWPPSSSRSAGQ